MSLAVSTMSLAELFVTLLLARLAHVATAFGTPPLVGLDSSSTTHDSSRQTAVHGRSGVCDKECDTTALLQQVLVISVMISCSLQDHNRTMCGRKGSTRSLIGGKDCRHKLCRWQARHQSHILDHHFLSDSHSIRMLLVHASLIAWLNSFYNDDTINAKVHLLS